MKAMATVKKYKGAILAGAGTLAAICVVITCGLLASCSSQADAGSINAREGVLAMMDEAEVLAEGMADGADEAEEAGASFDDPESAVAEDPAVQGQQGESPGSSTPQDTSSSTPAATSSTKGQTTSSASQSSTQKKWVEDTQQVWVEDKAAWTESVPVYGTKEVSICNVCGADVTGNTSAHSKAHMLAGEGSGHHSEVRQVVTGYNSVNHPAEGHYETRVVGGHWE